ncbi:hypothetical protein CC86DRAFT_409172 [Ophiobolus disseminans]|uniref:RBR-type E3 ubiquitin transferase n=1 Tax=Ophiobolus disseminans TaxID=1469910 RepID=A0A6A6ZSF4_9PLEO|nr:hypothetical protein CC86DRAFT_409172 [Ophiobolus disseminans]
MVVNKAPSIFPSELPERPHKLSLTKRLSQKLASSKTKRSQVFDISPSFPPVGYPLKVPVTNVTPHHVLTRNTLDQPSSLLTLHSDDEAISGQSNSKHRSLRTLFSSKRTDTGVIESSSLASATYHHTTVPLHPTIHRKPVASSVDNIIQDPLVERFQRLRLSQNGKLQPRSFEPAVSPPLSQTTSTSPSLPPTKDFFQAAKSTWDKIAVSGPSLPTLREERSIRRRRSDLERKPQSITRTRTDVGHPIDEGSDEEPNDVVPKRSSNPLHRRTVLHKRALSSSRDQVTALPRNTRRRSQSPSVSSGTSEGDLTPDSSEDVSYPDLSPQTVEVDEFVPSPTSERRKARFLDSEEASKVQEQLDRRLALQIQQEEEEQYQHFFYAQIQATDQSPSIYERRDTNRSRSCAGNRGNPIDLDSDDSDEVIFKGRSGGAGSYPDLMDLDDESWSCSLGGELDTMQATLDAELAQFLQEEEDRSRQTTTSTRECAVCGDSHPISELPALAECEHPPRTCADCYAGWVASQLEGSGWREAKCPDGECNIKLTYHEVQQIATPEIFVKYDTFIARAAISEDPNFRWCRACSSGQIHMSGVEGNIFTCASCNHKVCIIHENTWHEGETCEDFEYRSSGRKEADQKAQEAASLAAIGKTSKKCPGKNCVYNIEKNDGCDHMTCSKCRYEFCWICLCDYKKVRAVGNAAHARSCNYHTGRIRD